MFVVYNGFVFSHPAAVSPATNVSSPGGASIRNCEVHGIVAYSAGDMVSAMCPKCPRHLPELQ